MQCLIGRYFFLSMVGIDPDIIVAVGRALRGPPDTGDGIIDALERPVGEQRGRTAAMGLLVVTEEIQVNDRQPPGGIDLCTDRDQFAQQDGDRHPGWHEFQFLDEIKSTEQAAYTVHYSQQKFEHQKCNKAHKTPGIAQDQQSYKQWIGTAQRRPPSH